MDLGQPVIADSQPRPEPRVSEGFPTIPQFTAVFRSPGGGISAQFPRLMIMRTYRWSCCGYRDADVLRICVILCAVYKFRIVNYRRCVDLLRVFPHCKLSPMIICPATYFGTL